MQGSLDVSACKEWFSVAYVEALASTAGFAVTHVRVDQFGVDLEIRDKALRIDVQMKCTQVRSGSSANLAYPLDVRTYNLLSDPDRNVPGYLFVVEVPISQNKWTSMGKAGLTLRHHGYFQSMVGLAPTTNRTSNSVSIPRSNRLTVHSLQAIMKAARAGNG